ncbi:uncharacterized protein B0T23DRAFT_164883 [Neurospora hispaniola]|uniref:Uncharacterized protein n=1 Tax=Neurospora hispaniola TaxID=588809 RepID=A0AAJ0I5D1_9PEZI|nr:hypothetical protein B0T23DRAFT_164883 [Neurospora hispaniola]
MFWTTPNDLDHGLTQMHLIFCQLSCPSGKNCIASGAFAVHFRRALGNDNSLPVKTLWESILSCRNTTTKDNIMYGNVTAWFYHVFAVASDQSIDFSWDIQPITSPRDYCKKLEFQGNPDLASIRCKLEPQQAYNFETTG